MISIITSATVTSAADAAASLGLIAIAALLLCLVQKELLVGSRGDRARAMSAMLNVAIVPLLITFALMVVTRIVEVLN